jgi:hypothetical protein
VCGGDDGTWSRQVDAAPTGVGAYRAALVAGLSKGFIIYLKRWHMVPDRSPDVDRRGVASSVQLGLAVLLCPTYWGSTGHRMQQASVRYCGGCHAGSAPSATSWSSVVAGAARSFLHGVDGPWSLVFLRRLRKVPPPEVSPLRGYTCCLLFAS